MNYLTNYYKNLCEQLQEKITMLEAEIYGPEGKFMKAMEMGDKRIVNPYSQGQERRWDVEAMKHALSNKEHPIHKNPEHVADVQRVLADIEKIDQKLPGQEIASKIAQHAVGEKEYEDANLLTPFGWAKDAPRYGHATMKHMRTAVDVMRGTYGQKASQEAKPAGDHVTPSHY